mmetsp:Transcript_63722/g.103240  ORF Transcript_63722/g.103240 Transcript_63722/m.103240 type:complete len:208 (+) Transcript_63722:72-695(+)
MSWSSSAISSRSISSTCRSIMRTRDFRSIRDKGQSQEPPDGSRGEPFAARSGPAEDAPAAADAVDAIESRAKRQSSVISSWVYSGAEAMEPREVAPTLDLRRLWLRSLLCRRCTVAIDTVRALLRRRLLARRVLPLPSSAAVLEELSTGRTKTGSTDGTLDSSLSTESNGAAASPFLSVIGTGLGERVDGEEVQRKKLELTPESGAA